MGQLIAMGGGGFSMEPDNPLLDEYILAHSRSDLPKVCFVPTASGDAEGYVKSFYKSFGRFACQPTHLPLAELSNPHIDAIVMEQDILYIGGGDTRVLLNAWRARNFDRILRLAYERGTLLAGISAGSLCWFESGVTDDVDGSWAKIQGLGFLKGSHCPHFDSAPSGKFAYRELVLQGQLEDGIAVDDGVALHYVDSGLQSVISSRSGAFAYAVRRSATGIVEEKWTPRYLGTSKDA